MLGQRRRRQTHIEPALGQLLAVAGYVLLIHIAEMNG